VDVKQFYAIEIDVVISVNRKQVLKMFFPYVETIIFLDESNRLIFPDNKIK